MDVDGSRYRSTNLGGSRWVSMDLDGSRGILEPSFGPRLRGPKLRTNSTRTDTWFGRVGRVSDRRAAVRNSARIPRGRIRRGCRGVAARMTPNDSDGSPDRDESLWFSMDLAGSRWIAINLNGARTSAMDRERSRWTSMDLDESQRISMDLDGARWTARSRWISIHSDGSR